MTVEVVKTKTDVSSNLHENRVGWIVHEQFETCSMPLESRIVDSMQFKENEMIFQATSSSEKLEEVYFLF